MPPTTPQKLTSDQFAQSIKTQYPQYANVDNATLTQKILAKYPQYSDRVQSATPTPSSGGFLNTLGSIGGSILGGLNNIGTGIGTTIGKTGLGLGQAVLQGAQGIGNLIGDKPGAQFAGQAATTLGNLSNDIYQKPFEKQLNTTTGKIGQAIGTAATLISPGGAAKGAVTALPGVAEKIAANDAAKVLEAISPKLTAKETADAIAARGGTKTGILGTIKANTDPALKQVAAAVTKYVPDFNPSKTFTENVNATRNAVYGLADQLKQQVIASGKDVIYPFQELASKMNSVAKPIAIKSDATLNRQFDLAKNAALSIAKQEGGTISSLLDARKGFDQLVAKEFPNLYDKVNAPMRSAITAMRNTMNDFIASKLPQVAYKNSLKAQSNLFTAIDNLAEKAAQEVGTNVLQRAATVVKNHPVISGLGAAALYGEAKKVPGIGSFLP